MTSITVLPTPLNQYGCLAEAHMERFLPKETAKLKQSHQWLPVLLQYQKRMEDLMEAMTARQIDQQKIPKEGNFEYLLAQHQINRLQAEEQFFTQILPPAEV